jgi:Leucine-rich repeat (LRR) protein
VPGWLFAWPRLRVLSLAHTHLQALPLDVETTQLEALDLSNTPISSLPLWLVDRAPKLKRLTLGSNRAFDAQGEDVRHVLHRRGVTF